MALQSDLKLRVLYHLCYPATSLTVGNVNFNSVIRDRLSITDSAISDQIENTLTELDEAEKDIREYKKCIKVQQVGDITMNMDSIRNAKSEYMRLQKKLACSIDIPLNVYRLGGGVSI